MRPAGNIKAGLAAACLLASSLAYAARDVVIPPAVAPGGGAARLEVRLTLVDANGVQVPASTVSNSEVVAGLGLHVIEAESVTLPVATQSELSGETFYEIEVKQGRDRWTRRVQVPAGDGSPLTWAEFTGLGDPVDPPETRLLPDAALLDDDKWLTTVGAQWVVTDAPPGSGVREAPEDGTIYGRQDATWVEVAAVEVDPVYTASAAAAVTSALISEWSAAYGWGDHASAGYLTSYTETDPVYSAAPAAGITSQNLTDWASAFGWGDHGSAGYAFSADLGTAAALDATPAAGECVQWDGSDLVGAGAACGSGTGSTDLTADYLAGGVTIESSTGADVTLLPAQAGVSAGVLSAAQAQTLADALQSETDPVYLASDAAGVTDTLIGQWSTAYGWGDHGAAGYLSVEVDPTVAGGIATHASAADPHTGYLLESAAATVATTGAYADLSGTPTLGTAAALDAGTTIGDLIALADVGGSAGLPEVDGSQLSGLPLGRLAVTATGDLATGDIDITGGDDAVIVTVRLTGDAVTLDVTPPASGGYAVLLVLDSDDGTHTLAIAQQTVPIYTPLGTLTGITPPAGSPTLYQITALTTGIWLTPVPTAVALAAAP